MYCTVFKKTSCWHSLTVPQIINNSMVQLMILWYNMPRTGYKSVTIDAETHDDLAVFKDKNRLRSISDAVRKAVRIALGKEEVA